MLERQTFIKMILMTMFKTKKLLLWQTMMIAEEKIKSLYRDCKTILQINYFILQLNGTLLNQIKQWLIWKFSLFCSEIM